MKISEKDIGRRVVVNGEYDDEIFKNEPGVFKCFGVFTYNPGIMFDKSRQNFHTLDNRCKNKYGFYVPKSMITFTDEDDKMDMDFQEGDAVEHLRKGLKGKVLNICKDSIEVKFDNGQRGVYYLNGNKSDKDTIPTIYHAGSIKREGPRIIIDPVKPVRENWYNIYRDEDGPFFGASGYGSKEEAVKEIMSDRDYITTIQLKRSTK